MPRLDLEMPKAGLLWLQSGFTLRSICLDCLCLYALYGNFMNYDDYVL